MPLVVVFVIAVLFRLRRKRRRHDATAGMRDASGYLQGSVRRVVPRWHVKDRWL